MNDQSAFRVANLGAAPAGPTGAGRLKMLVMGAATVGGLSIGVGLYVAQLVLPTFLHPSTVAGTAAGETEKADIDVKQATVIAYERGKADATTQATIKGQVDAILIQKTLDTTTESLAPVTALAGLSDGACMVSNIVAALSAPTGRVIGDWRNGRTDYDTADLNHAAKAFAGATCGMGDPLRNSVRAAQVDAVREVAAVRGMSMNNGAVQVAAAPAPASAATINLALAPHQRFNNDQQAELRAYAHGMPDRVRIMFTDGLDMAHGWPDAWFDRVAYYRAARNG